MRSILWAGCYRASYNPSLVSFINIYIFYGFWNVKNRLDVQKMLFWKLKFPWFGNFCDTIAFCRQKVFFWTRVTLKYVYLVCTNCVQSYQALAENWSELELVWLRRLHSPHIFVFIFKREVQQLWSDIYQFIFSKFYGKIGVVSQLDFHLIWKPVELKKIFWLDSIGILFVLHQISAHVVCKTWWPWITCLVFYFFNRDWFPHFELSGTWPGQLLCQPKNLTHLRLSLPIIQLQICHNDL